MVSYYEKEARLRLRLGHSDENICAELKIEPTYLERLKLGHFVVRVVTHERYGPLLEALAENDILVLHRTDASGTCFDIVPHIGILDTMAWADALAENLSDRGFNAVRAPRWSE